MPRNVSDRLRIEHASPEDQAEALTLLFSRLPSDDREKRVAQLLAQSGGGPPEGLWVGYRDKRLAAAVLVQVQPGRTAVVSLPQIAQEQSPETARELLAGVVANLPRQGVQIAQSLLETDQGPDAELLTACGFRHISNLLFLVSVQGSFPTAPPNDDLGFAAYRDELLPRLSGIVARTYQGSLDCPVIDGVRRIEDVLAGYRATGVFDPARWIIVAHQDIDIGCILLTDHPHSDEWELLYMGVVPEARGHGWGVAMVRHAQWLTRQARRSRLVLAVDADNSPALDVYASAGFVTWDHRSVYVRIF